MSKLTAYEKALKKVRRGIKTLDAWWGKNQRAYGWRDLIDLATLNIVMLHDCVFGQVYGNYEFACRGFGHPVDDWNEERQEYRTPVSSRLWLERHGFNAGTVKRQELLTQVWRDELHRESDVANPALTAAELVNAYRSLSGANGATW